MTDPVVVSLITDTVATSGSAPTLPLVTAVDAVTDTVISEVDYSPNSAGQSSVATQIGQAVDQLQQQLEQQRQQVAADIQSASDAAVAQATAASSAAIAALQGAVAAAQLATQDALDAVQQSVTQLRTDLDGQIAVVSVSLTTVSNAQQATTSEVTTLQSQYGVLTGTTIPTIQASVTDAAATAASATEAVAGDLSAFQATYDQNYSSITGQLSTLSSAQQSTATNVTTLQSQYGTLANSTIPAIQATIAQNATTAANATSAVAASLLDLTTDYDQHVASYDQQISTLSSEQTTTATAVTDLTTTVNGVSSSVQTLQGSVNGLYAQYQVTVAAGSQSGFLSITGVAHPDGTGSVGIELSADTIVLHGNVIFEGTVDQNKLTGEAQGNLTSPHTTVYLTTPGSDTFTVPAGVYWLYVKVWGGGGGGGSCNAGGTGTTYGGGGGGYASKTIPVMPGDQISYVVGQGGACYEYGINAFNVQYTIQEGSAGTTTSFGSSLSATGGQYYSSTNYNNGDPAPAGGTGQGGDFNFTGQPGGGGNNGQGCAGGGTFMVPATLGVVVISGDYNGYTSNYQSNAPNGYQPGGGGASVAGGNYTGVTGLGGNGMIEISY